MDIEHLKYAVEVERTGSISKAAEKLYVSQPFLSKAIRELESDVGIDIFNRGARGVTPTKKGAEFLESAKEVLEDFAKLENAYRTKTAEEYRFEITVPIACYISHAFVEFVSGFTDREKMSIDYRETGTMNTIKHVAEHDSSMGIIRYQLDYEDYYLRYLASKELVAKPIWEFQYRLIMSKLGPLARKPIVELQDLDGLIEISHGYPDVPSLPASAMQELRRRGSAGREVVVYERQSQFELLCRIPETYMWASPTPRSVFATYPLVQKECPVPGNRYKDVLIYRKSYKLSQEDHLFIGKIDETVQQL